MRLECSVCDTYVVLPDNDYNATDKCFYAPDCTGTLLVTEGAVYEARDGECDYCGYEGRVTPYPAEIDDFVYLCEECEP